MTDFLKAFRQSVFPRLFWEISAGEKLPGAFRIIFEISVSGLLAFGGYCRFRYIFKNSLSPRQKVRGDRLFLFVFLLPLGRIFRLAGLCLRQMFTRSAEAVLRPMPGLVRINSQPVISIDTSPTSGVQIDLFALLSAVWRAVFIVKMTALLLSRIALEKSAKSGAKPEAVKILDDIKTQLDIKKNVRLYVCPNLSTPIAAGVMSPFILLPAEDYSEGELQFILRHELTHIRHWDIFFKTLYSLAAAIHWFNPAVYRACKLYSVDCELSCDEAVMRGKGAECRRQYADTLLAAAAKKPSRHTALSTGFYNDKNMLKERLKVIMSENKKNLKTAVFALLPAVVIALCRAVGYDKLGPRAYRENTAVFSDEELISMAKTYYSENHGGYMPDVVEIDSETDEKVVIHLYDMGELSAMTLDWYTVDRRTGEGENLLFEPVDLKTAIND